jgi:hypothetical protein
MPLLPRTLSSRVSLRALRPEIGYTLSRFKAEPLAAKYIAPFEGLLTQWGTTNDKEQSLYDDAIEIKALVFARDRTLNVLASRLSKTVLILTGDDRTHSLYTHFFGKKSLKEFTRPTLGAQLGAMRAWIPSLKTSEHEGLKALSSEIEAAVAAADEAAKKKAAIEQETKIFRETGERKKFVDACNAARKLAHGELSKLAHENDGLPLKLADSFFLHEVIDREAVTMDTVTERIAELNAELTEQQELLAQLKIEEEEKAQAEAERLANRAALAELEKVKKDAEKKAAALRTKLKT